MEGQVEMEVDLEVEENCHNNGDGGKERSGVCNLYHILSKKSEVAKPLHRLLHVSCLFFLADHLKSIRAHQPIFWLKKW